MYKYAYTHQSTVCTFISLIFLAERQKAFVLLRVHTCNPPHEMLQPEPKYNKQVGVMVCLCVVMRLSIFAAIHSAANTLHT